MNPPHSPDPRSAQRELLSRLSDGDADAVAAGQASEQWRNDATARATWHRYQLIGDAMRSDDLASTPRRDADFLAQLRQRMQQEQEQEQELQQSAVAMSSNVVALPTRAPSRPVPRWLAPAAVAAGFVAVAGVLVVTRFAAPGLDGSAAQQLAFQPAAAGLQRAAVGTASAAAVRGAGGGDVMDAALVRDAEIDRYFRAHRDMRVSPAAALPGGALRSVDTIVPQR